MGKRAQFGGREGRDTCDRKSKLSLSRALVLAALALPVAAASGSAKMGDRVVDVCRGSLGEHWVGYANGCLNSSKLEARAFESRRFGPGVSSSLSSGGARNLCEDSSGLRSDAVSGGHRWFRAGRAADRPVLARIGGAHDGISNLTSGVIEGIDDLGSADFDFGVPLGDERRRPMDPVGPEDAVAFFPGAASANNHPPEFLASDTTRAGEFSKFFSGDQTAPKVSLNYPDKSVTLALSALDSVSHAENRYRYQLMGSDPDRVELGHHRGAANTDLPSGEYQFVLRATNSDGTWTLGDARSQLTVVPPSWQTSWVYAAYGLVLLALIWVLVRGQNRKLQVEIARARELEHQIEVRAREFDEHYNDLRSLNNQLREFCLRDSLTGLRNRRYLYEFLDTETALFERSFIDFQNNTKPQAGLDLQPNLFFMMIDLDGFKTINDDYGHHAGDQALVQVCDILRKCARRSDNIIRWGGDEFLLVGQSGGPLGAERLAERVRSEIHHHHYQVGNGYEARLSASIGLSMYPFVPAAPNLVTWEQLIDISDQASYLAKQTRKNAWVAVYSTDKTTEAEPIRTLKVDIEPLLQRGVVNVNTSIKGGFAAALAASADQAN